MAIDTIKSTAVLDGTIATADIADGAVSGVKLANNLNYDSGTLYLDSTNNRVGVGTTTPTHPLTVNGQIKSIGANGETIQLQTSSQYSGVSFVGSDGTRDAIIDYDHTTGIMGLKAHTSGHAINFATGGYTERMRINSSGDLLVGKTSVDYTTVGFEATPSSIFQANAMTADGKKALLLARKTSDGEIVQFRKDTTSVGSIGTLASNLWIGTGNTALRFAYAGLNTIVPWNTTTNAPTDNTTSLGYSNTRFNNLYLGGGVYLGGTGSANHLDDYEEGTWTPVIRGSSSAGSYTTTTTYAKYRKVGNIVHISAYIGNITQSSAGSGYLQITGTPFQKPANQYFAGTVFVNQFNVASTAITFTLEPITYANSTSTFYVHIGHDNTSASNLLLSELVNGNSDLALSATYFTE